jgi:hypothetical protein
MERFEIVATFRNRATDTDPFRHLYFSVYAADVSTAVAVVTDLTRDHADRLAVTVNPIED